MGKNQPDERLIYLALKNTFKGADAQVRKPKKIRELIQKQQQSRDVRDLVHAHNLDNVCNVAKVLLDQQIFESTLKAKTRFPEVFEVSPAQSAERSASEEEAARTEADAIKVAAEGPSGAVLPEDHNAIAEKGPGDPFSPLAPSTRSRKRSSVHADPGVPSLYPVYLPYRTQHRLLSAVQHLLERACYGFGTRSLPETMAREQWECPESVELNKWPSIFRSKKEKFFQEDIDELGKPLTQLLDSITQIRHTAVHRLRVSANRLEQFLVDAESLSRLLHDDSCAQELSRLRRETQMTIDDVRRNKDLLESQLSSKLKKIAYQKAELERLEQIAISDMLKEDKEYQILAGVNLDQAMESPVTALQSVAGTDRETESDGDLAESDGNDLDASLGKDDWRAE